jgi:hypothetical protein
MAEEMHAFNAALKSPEARGVPGVPVRAAEIAWRRAINPESTRSGSSRLAKGLLLEECAAYLRNAGYS